MAQDLDLERYAARKDGGSSAEKVYRAAMLDGLSRIDCIRVVRSLFALSLEAAREIVSSVEDPPPGQQPPGTLPPLRTWEELERVLEEELAYCGCDYYEDAIYLLRDVLRCARDWNDGLSSKDDERLARARQTMKERLGYEQNPGLATWFLYWLDRRDLIWHGSRVSVCGINPKGRWLLEAIERLYPPPERDGEEPAEEES